MQHMSCANMPLQRIPAAAQEAPGLATGQVEAVQK